MRQLVELREAAEKLSDRNAVVVVVFREENLGVEGLRKSRENTAAKFTLLIDPKSKATSDYSRGGFNTYIIDEQGVVRSVLTGTKVKRPATKAVLAALDKLPKKKIAKKSVERANN